MEPAPGEDFADVSCQGTHTAMPIISDAPPAWRTRFVQQLSPEDRLTLFKCTHAAASIVLRHSHHVKLDLAPCAPDEPKTAAARRHHVAMYLAEGATRLKLHISTDVLSALPPCIHSGITVLHLSQVQLSDQGLAALCLERLNSLQSVALTRMDIADGSLENMHLQLPKPITVMYKDCSLQCVLQLGSVLGHAVNKLQLGVAAPITTSHLRDIAARYPAVTHIAVFGFGPVSAEVLLLEWGSLQYLDVDELDVPDDISRSSRTWQQLVYRQPTIHNLAYLPLGGFQRIVLHNLVLYKLIDKNREELAAQAVDNLKCCSEVVLENHWKPSFSAVAPPGMTGDRMVWTVFVGLALEELKRAFETLGLFHSQRPAVYFRSCYLTSDTWMPSMQHLPLCVSTLVFWDCGFRQGDEEAYWVQFAEAIPAHLSDLALQLESYQQAVAVITAVSRFQHPVKLWLYLGKAKWGKGTLPPDWWDQLSKLRKQLRPSLKLHLSDIQ